MGQHDDVIPPTQSSFLAGDNFNGGGDKGEKLERFGISPFLLLSWLCAKA